MNGDRGRRSQDLSNFIDEHLRELKWTSYGLGACAVLILVRKLKVTKKFVAVDQIPLQYITKSYTLQGHVRHTTDQGVLKIEHTPILEIKWVPSIFKFVKSGSNASDECGHLSVLPAGLDMTPDAVSWLKEHASGKHAWFQILARDAEHVLCDVRVKKGYLSRVSVSQVLVEQGLSKVQDFQTPPSSEYFHQYLRRLIALENKASQKGRGMWKEEKDGDCWRRKSTGLYLWCAGKLKRLFRRE